MFLYIFIMNLESFCTKTSCNAKQEGYPVRRCVKDGVAVSMCTICTSHCDYQGTCVGCGREVFGKKCAIHKNNAACALCFSFSKFWKKVIDFEEERIEKRLKKDVLDEKTNQFFELVDTTDWKSIIEFIIQIDKDHPYKQITYDALESMFVSLARKRKKRQDAEAQKMNLLRNELEKNLKSLMPSLRSTDVKEFVSKVNDMPDKDFESCDELMRWLMGIYKPSSEE